MPTLRIVPCLDVRDGRVVKGIRFQGLRDAGDPVEQAARYARATQPSQASGSSWQGQSSSWDSRNWQGGSGRWWWS